VKHIAIIACVAANGEHVIGSIILSQESTIPPVERISAESEIKEEDAQLLMDHCLSHLASDMMDLVNAARVRVATFANHTTQIFQLLDLIFFAIFKRQGKYNLPFGDLGMTFSFVHNVSMKEAKMLTSQTHEQYFTRLL
jgi:hypothetical protein